MSVVIRDIIEVPVVETVVKLGDSSSSGEGLVRDFVLTSQVAKNLRSIASAFKEKTGRGYFLVGAYGSGKSHFLSYISLVASGEIVPLDPAKCPVSAALDKNRLLPVRLSLVSVRGKTAIEDALLEEIENAIVSRGGGASLTRRSRFMDFFEGSIIPHDKSGFDAYLKKNAAAGWEKLRKSPEKAAAAAWGYMKTLSEKPQIPDAAPDRLLELALDHAQKLGFGGILIVIDELSEFLRSKPLQNLLNEDARYLQLLGETARSHPLWIVASLQESIEETGNIARDIIGKIKDRYPVRLSLNEQHVRELIDGRLVRKAPDAREKIRGVWECYKDSLAGFDIDFDAFYRIYPVHPDTISYLENLSFLFSAHRGIVDFIVSEVRGDRRRETQGMLDKPAEALLTADRIYEHFIDRIREDERYQEFDTIVRKDILRAIDVIFRDEYDRDLARRACDVLILNEIAELSRPKTVSDLARILLVAATGISRDANEQYLRDVILLPILKESLFLRCTSGVKAGDAVFAVSRERDKRGLYEQELKQVLSGIDASDSRILSEVASSVQPSIPFRELLGGVRPEIAIPWRGTQRKGLLFWMDQGTFDDVSYAVSEKCLDFGVVIAPAECPELKKEELSLLHKSCHSGESRNPTRLNALDPRFRGDDSRDNYLVQQAQLPQNIVVWTPSWERDELESLRNYYGALLIGRRQGAGGVLKAAADEALRVVEGGKAEMAKTIEKGYARGRFVGKGIEMAAQGARYGAQGFIERYAGDAVIAALKLAHPRFLDVAPQVDFVSRRLLSPLVESIISAGRISMAAARKSGAISMIEGVLVPMGIAKASGSSFVMNLDPSSSHLAHDVLNAVEAGGISVPKLIDHLCNGPFGLTRDLAGILVISMVRGGLLELRKGSRRIPSGIVGFSQLDEAETVHAGDLLSVELQEKFFKDALLMAGAERGPFSLALQKEGWERLLEFKGRFLALSSRVSIRLSELSSYPLLDSFDFDGARKNIEEGTDSLNEVKETASSSNGLSKYLSSGAPDLQTIIEALSAADLFLEKDAPRLIRAADYMKDVARPPEMPGELAEMHDEIAASLSRLSDVVSSGKGEAVVDEFEKFREAYAAWYVTMHQKEFAPERFKPLENVRRSAAYSALSTVESVSGINLVDSVHAVDLTINAAMSKRCAISPASHLRLHAVCPCGFVPGNKVDLPDVKEIERTLERGLDEARDALLAGGTMERIVARISALKDMDEEKAALLEKFFHRLKAGVTTDVFAGMITPAMARLLDEALKRRVTIVPRSVDELSERLKGRRLPPGRVRGIMEEWLGVTGGGDVLIDMGGSATSGEDSAMAAWIADHGLDENRARMEMVVPLDVQKKEDSGVFNVDDGRLKKMCELLALADLGPIECLDILRRERRVEAFAWEVAKRIAAHLADGGLESGLIGGDCSQFGEVSRWVEMVSRAVRPFEDGGLEKMISSESPRDAAMSYVFDIHCRKGNITSVELEKIKETYEIGCSHRNGIFKTAPEWNISFGDLAGEYRGGLFIFVDAARWDLVPGLAGIIGDATGRKPAKTEWLRVREASTAAWQRALFGSDEMEVASGMIGRTGMKYWASVTDAKVRRKMREAGKLQSAWINVSFIDRLIHSSDTPLYLLLERALADFTQIISDIAPAIKADTPVIMMTDHGFSETRASGAPKYHHSPSNISDQLAVMTVWK